MGLASDGIRACLNFAGDDGISCVPNATGCRPVQDGFTSWDTLMSEISPMLQQRDKLFSVNTGATAVALTANFSISNL